MKKRTDCLTHYRHIDLVPLIEAYERMAALMLTMIGQGLWRKWAKQSAAVLQASKDMTRAHFKNRQLDLKLRMLSTKIWRERVLKELGGEAALESWERRMAAFEAASDAPQSGSSQTSSWRKTPERIEEELRQIAHKKLCAKATAHPRIFRDPFRVDFNGTFRLAPVPRQAGPRRMSLDVLATTPDYVERYEFNGMPMNKLTGLDAPVSICPAEFRAAAKLDAVESLRAARRNIIMRREDSIGFIDQICLPYLVSNCAAEAILDDKPP